MWIVASVALFGSLLVRSVLLFHGGRDLIDDDAITLFGIYVMLSALLYMAGAAVAWIIRGFTNKEKQP